ncbi:MAG: insulinase family protein [Acidobacteria bacterium]|nr:insulinase family protein [Acidobacteriota bacterium]MBI3655414.1 insulinase family protein [Acidobacteriota bacterium]
MMVYLRLGIVLWMAGVGAALASESGGRTVTLDNGLEITLIEYHANPMIACVAVVKTGLADETPANNGVSHMLEHLLFNGTKQRTQDQLYSETDFYGIYNNAHTDDLYTNFMVLAPAEFVEKALDVQSDMLFNSTLPPEKLEKERGIVIEEIGKDNDRIESLANRYFRRIYYRGTPHAMPVLGTVTSITHLTRDQILDHYKTFYVPNNMAAVVIGDFKTEPMLDLLKKYFGRYAAKDLPSSPRMRAAASAPKRDEWHVQLAKTGRSYLRLGLPAPAMADPDFYPFYMLSAWLTSGENAPLTLALKGGAKPPALHVSSDYEFRKDSGTLRLSVSAAPGVSKQAIVERIRAAFIELGRDPVSARELRNLITSIKTNDIFLSEKLHYYGMSLSPLLAMASYQFAAELTVNLEKVTPEDVRRVAAAYLPKPMVITSIEPVEASGEKAEKKPAKIVKQVFPNGLTLIVNENQDSRVFAVHVLAKDRSAREPQGQAGIADLMHQMLPRGTRYRSKSEIAAALQSMGAVLKVSDDPSIPYDDYYTTPAYSYIRFETIDEFHEAGLELLADLINHPAFDEAELPKLKAQVIDLLRRNRESARERAREKFYTALCAHLPEGKSVMGTEATVTAATRADLEEFHKRYFAPNNLIISIVTNLPAEKIIGQVQKLFDRLAQPLPPLDARPCRVSQATAPIVEKMGKEQSYLYLGALIRDVAPGDRAALEIMNAILSASMSFELREKKGLAYSVGTSIGLRGDWGWLIASIGTRAKNLEAVRQGIGQHIETLRTAVPAGKDVEKAVNAHIGRVLMRRLSRISAAYYYGLYEFEGLGYDYYERSLVEWRNVSKADVERVAMKYLPQGEYVTVIVE